MPGGGWWVVVFIVMALGVAAGGWYMSQKAQGMFVLPELSASLDLGLRADEYTYQPRAVQGVGTVAFVSSPSLTAAAEHCELGVLYRLKKEGFEQYRTSWTLETLELASQGGDIPPQVKEFDDSYLVFEPSQAVCSTDQEAEIVLRSGLLGAMGSAESTGPAR